jgi:hypothetical protein
MATVATAIAARNSLLGIFTIIPSLRHLFVAPGPRERKFERALFEAEESTP